MKLRPLRGSSLTASSEMTVPSSEVDCWSKAASAVTSTVCPTSPTVNDMLRVTVSLTPTENWDCMAFLKAWRGGAEGVAAWLYVDECEVPVVVGSTEPTSVPVDSFLRSTLAWGQRPRWHRGPFRSQRRPWFARRARGGWH